MNASLHTFCAGDRVRYSVTVKSLSGRTAAHHTGLAIILQRCGGETDRPAYLVRTPQGKIKMLFASELRSAPAESVAQA